RRLVSEKDFYYYCNELFNAKHYKKLIILSNDTSIGYDRVRFLQLLLLFRVSYISNLDKTWISSALKTPHEHFLKNALLNSALDCLVRVEQSEQVLSVVQNIDDKQLNSIPFPTLRGICNLLIKHEKEC